MIIIGAGYSGLIAAHSFKNFKILERMERPKELHQALLRFRSDTVSRLTGIEFKKVTVRKGIWYDDTFCEPSIQLANLYSSKCLGAYTSRSIWDISTVERYIAPENFYEQLIDFAEPNIEWGQDVQVSQMPTNSPIISTMPMPELIKQLDFNVELEFKRAAIFVLRYTISDCDLYQTIYYPSEMTPVYRASITGSLLIIESMEVPSEYDVNMVFESFGILSSDVEKHPSTSSQKYGKIQDIDDSLRKHLIGRITDQHNIYSMGRFAIWKNVLLDDVVQDASVIKKMMHSHQYDRKLIRHK